MKTYSLDDFFQALEKTQSDNHKNTCYFIHSSLLSLGRLANTAPTNYANTLFDALKDWAGNSATLCMPTFNYQFPKTRHADLTREKSELGAWPNWFLSNAATARSGHPIFSIAAYGPEAEAICQPNQPEYNAFDQNSTFARLHNINATLLFIGTDLKVATFVVYCEAALQLKYRFLKPFFGSVTLQLGQTIEDDFYHFCFPLNNAYRENYDQLIQYLKTSGTINEVPLGGSSLFSINAHTLYNAVAQLTHTNPHALLNSHPTHYYHYVNGEEQAYEIN